MYGVHIREVVPRLIRRRPGSESRDSRIRRSDVLTGRGLSPQPTVVVAILAVALWQVTAQQLKILAQGRDPRLERKL